MLRVALNRDDVDGVRLVRVDIDHETEIRRQIPADLFPGIAGVFRAQDIPMLLHKEYIGARAIHGDAVNAMADLSRGVGDVKGMQAAIDRLPSLARVVG